MATAAQIEANRANAKRSTGRRSELGKSRSRLNALNHGFRANLLVLPTEEFGEYANHAEGYRLSFRPRNPSEEFLVDSLSALHYQTQRIQAAHTARLAARINHGELDEAECEQKEVIALGQRLFQDPNAPKSTDPNEPPARSARDARVNRSAGPCLDPDHPALLVIDLAATSTGCAWLLEQWESLRSLLERGIPWLPADATRAVRLMGRNTNDVFIYDEVARIYLATHVLRNESGDPFQDLLDSLPADERPRFERSLMLREYRVFAPRDAATAKQILLEMIDRATEKLNEKADVLREVAEANAPYTSARLSWDDTPEGERLRRYEMANDSKWFRMFNTLLKIREKAEELDIATIESLRRSVPTFVRAPIDEPGQAIADVANAPAEGAPQPAAPSEANAAPAKAPNEPNSAAAKAPNEPNSPAQAPSGKVGGGIKELRIDTPHRDHTTGAIGTGGRKPIDHDIDRVLGNRNRPLLDLSPILGKG
jgi:hypothetical protein